MEILINIAAFIVSLIIFSPVILYLMYMASGDEELGFFWWLKNELFYSYRSKSEEKQPEDTKSTEISEESPKAEPNQNIYGDKGDSEISDEEYRLRVLQAIVENTEKGNSDHFDDSIKNDPRFYTYETLEVIMTALCVSLEADLKRRKEANGEADQPEEFQEEYNKIEDFEEEHTILEEYMLSAENKSRYDHWNIESSFFLMSDANRYEKAFNSRITKRAVEEPIFFESIDVDKSVFPYTVSTISFSVKKDEDKVNRYYTTLTRCTCPFFLKNRVVCKHMMALAIKVEAVTVDVEEVLDRY